MVTLFCEEKDMSNLKSLAQKAKNRLKSVGLNATCDEIVAGEDVIKKCAVSYMLASTNKAIEEDKLYPKIKAMMEKDIDNPFPLRELIDKKLYSSLSATDKEKYILDLSRKYNTIREKILLGSKNL